MTVQRFYTGQPGGLQALADADVRRQQYITCMRAYSWSPSSETPQPDSYQVQVEADAKTALPVLQQRAIETR